jgi:hypothetical protein
MKYIPLLDSLLFAGSRALALSVAAAATVMSTANAATYTEIGDTGDVPFSAQETPFDPLDPVLSEIYGSFETNLDIDMYLIYISDPSTFSATVTTSGDTQLFLFNVLGFGIASNDDQGLVSFGAAALPAGNPLLTALVPDYYYLAVGGFNHEPVSDPGNPTAEFIFGQSATAVNGPTGAGGGSPIIGWSVAPGNGAGPYNYTIALTGAEGATCPTCNQVPDSGTTLSLLGLSLGGLFLGTRKLKAKV